MNRREGKRPFDEDVVFIDGDGGAEDVERALAEAVGAVEAVEQRHKAAAQPEAVVEAPPEPPAPPESPPPSADAAAVLVAELDRQVTVERERAIQAEEDAGRLREVLLRKTADFDNLKRRTEREKADYFRFALADTLRDLLPVLDNFERAMAHAGDGTSSGDFRAGIEMISKQLAETLRRYGLAEIAAEGLPFDPNVHEAVARVETSSLPMGTVAEVLQKGYMLNDRLLRPALVKVAAPPSAPGLAAGAGEGRVSGS